MRFMNNRFASAKSDHAGQALPSRRSHRSWVTSRRLTVTTADGTTSVETLAQAGITSIDLVPQDADVQQVDGSIETGQTTYTKTDGSTGTAVDMTLAYDSNGYAVQQTVTHNADGSTTVDNKAYAILSLFDEQSHTDVSCKVRIGDEKVILEWPKMSVGVQIDFLSQVTLQV